MEPSPLQRVRMTTPPVLPELLAQILATTGGRADGHALGDASPADPAVCDLFPELTREATPGLAFSLSENTETAHPLRVGVVLSGGQAPGGANVIAGLFDMLKHHHPESELHGFLCGPRGIFAGDHRLMTAQDDVDAHRNLGGFDILGSGRDKIRTDAQFAASLATANALSLDGIVVIGGDDSNTNAALLGEYFAAHGSSTVVVGVPKTIDGDLRTADVEVSFGFDTASRVFSESIGSIAADCNSTRKYWHFVRLMGRSASTLTLECALQTRPNVALIGEEIAAHGTSLAEITSSLCDLIATRALAGHNFGVALIPEGLVEFVPEIGGLIAALNDALSADDAPVSPSPEDVGALLSEDVRSVFVALPRAFQEQLLLDRDAHGNVQVAKIESERLIASMCEAELAARAAADPALAAALRFKPNLHYLGYESRSALPSEFDSAYCTALGMTAALLVANGHSGYMSVVRGLAGPVAEWAPGGAPIVNMMHIERRHGHEVPVIAKALVQLDGPMFTAFAGVRDAWGTGTRYSAPGPIQFGSDAGRSARPFIVCPPTAADVEGWVAAAADGATNGFWAARGQADESPLQASRRATPPRLPSVLCGPTQLVTRHSSPVDATVRVDVAAALPHLAAATADVVELVPVAENTSGTEHAGGKRIGVVLCGRQAPGINNIVCGVASWAAKAGWEAVGIVGGTLGLFEGSHVVLTPENTCLWMNQGGCDMLGRTVDQLETDAQLSAAVASCVSLSLDTIVLVGGPRTHLGGAHLVNALGDAGVATQVVCVPASIDGDFGHAMMEACVGFDTVSKVCAGLVGNVLTDAASSRKYWFFIRLIGRSPSHVVTEVALQTHPNVVVIAEECEAHALTLRDVVTKIADAVESRAAHGHHYGAVLLPEGLPGGLLDMRTLIRELNGVVSSSPGVTCQAAAEALSPWSRALYTSLPAETQASLLAERESSGSVQFSQIESERLLSFLVGEEMKARGVRFSAVTHWFGYQGRSVLPSLLDARLGWALGHAAGALAQHGCHGVSVGIRGMLQSVEAWRVGAVPLAQLVGADADGSPAVVPTKVSLTGAAFRELAVRRGDWIDDAYANPGPIQYDGACAEDVHLTCRLTHGGGMDGARQLEKLCADIRAACLLGGDRHTAVALESLGSLKAILSLLSSP